MQALYVSALSGKILCGLALILVGQTGFPACDLLPVATEPSGLVSIAGLGHMLLGGVMLARHALRG